MTTGPTYADIALPVEGALAVVRPGVRWLRMPIPIPLKHVNLWVLGDGDGVILVDTGMNHELCRSIWAEVAATVDTIGPVRAVVCTHWHPDHFGLAATLQARFQVPVWLHAADQAACAEFWEAPSRVWAQRNRAFYAEHGFVPEPAFDAVLSLAEYRSGIEGLPADLRPLDVTDRFDVGGLRWAPILVQGHTQGHLCLYCRDAGLLISGDQLLPTISTNISVSLMQNGEDPLGQYLDSLRVLGSLPAATLVLPAHGRPFLDPAQRTGELIRHHEEQLDLAAHACDAPRTAAEVAPQLFRRKLDGMSMVLAMGETISHLRRLVAQGRLREAQDTRGVRRFERIAQQHMKSPSSSDDSRRNAG